MSWRKCLVRGLVFSVLAALAGLGWLYQHLTDPAIVRQQVISHFEEKFLTTSIRLESAGLRLLGGISVTDLRLIRQTDPEKHDLIYVPSGIIYHDKEQLLDGKLAIRKLELNRPRLHFIRNRDGTWNSTKLLGPVDPNDPIPTIVIRQGTILIEDRYAMPDAAPLELKNVNLTVVNDPRPTLIIQLQGVSDLLGPVQAHAIVQRATDAVSLTVEAAAVPIDAPLGQRLAGYSADFSEHLKHLRGQAKVRIDLGYQPGAEHPWTHDLQVQIKDGRLDHPLVPLVLENIAATLRCAEGHTRIEKLTAQSGATRIELEGSATGLTADADFEGKLTAENLQLTDDFFHRLPDRLEKLRSIQDDYALRGQVRVEGEISRQKLHGALPGDEPAWRWRFGIAGQDVSACYAGFPYRLNHMQGRIECQCDDARHLKHTQLDLVGKASGDRPLHIRGNIIGEGSKPAVHIDLWSENVPLDDRLREAMSPKFREIADSFHPTGKGDFVVQLRRKAGAEQFANRTSVHFHDMTVRYDVFPYPLEDVSGVLDILPDHWEFRDFRGSHNGGEFRTWGKSQPAGDGSRVGITIQGSNILLDDELVASLTPKLQSAWKSLNVGGRMSFAAQVDQLPDKPEDIAVAVSARGCTLQPSFFPYLLTDVSGTVRYAKDKVDLEKLSGRHGSTVITLNEGKVLLKPGGGFWARADRLRGAPLILDADLQTALPPALQKLCAAADPGTSVGMAAELVVDMPAEPNMPPVVYWDGGIGVQDARFQAGVDLDHVRGQFWCRGRHNGRQLDGLLGNLMLEQAVMFKQPLRDIHTHVEIAKESPEVVCFPDLKGKLFGGDIGGEVRAEFGPTLHYDVNLTALGIRLEEFGQHNLPGKADLKGLAAARLYLSGHGNDMQGLEGNGSVDVPQGQMYNLPIFLDLMKVIGLRLPDRTAFEEAHATFGIHGPRVSVTRLDLDGNAISLSGTGGMNLDGSDIQLDFYAVWGRIKQWLLPMFRDIPPAISQQLLKIKLRGKVDDLHITKEPVPGLVEPLERLLKRAAGREAAEASTAKSSP